MGYSPWGWKESDMIEQLTLHFLPSGLRDLRKRGKSGESLSFEQPLHLPIPVQ